MMRPLFPLDSAGGLGGDVARLMPRTSFETNFTAPCKSAMAAVAVPDDPSCTEQ